ncbi:hypothetical protein G5B30_00920 [Sphingobacterium sp. SGG-5]|uniref:hypothetical protein n=1 Tax=Sphingobacterium sp. SGG-5 TaxID=2710881 RepID=UPI0013EADFF2|nr:hypothetical protein [Sphingobacterium sp. SGG-5]NGM60466.1 hypothetical protein [Sphingobacterium sp. SGG-5]
MTIIGFSAFQILDDPESGWYEISTPSGDPNQPEDQQIDGFTDTNPPLEDECNTANQAEPCQVNLDLSSFSSSTPLEDMTVEQAVDSGAVAIQYAKRPE